MGVEAGGRPGKSSGQEGEGVEGSVVYLKRTGGGACVRLQKCPNHLSTAATESHEKWQAKAYLPMWSPQVAFLHYQNLFVLIDDEAPDADHRVGEFGELGWPMRREPFEHEDVLWPRVVELEAQRRTNRNEGRMR